MASGTLSIYMPDGTMLTDNASVLSNTKPSDFSLAPLSASVTFEDEDDDIPGNPALSLGNAGVTWDWKGPDDTPLTTTQLNQQLGLNFSSGTVLTVTASAPVESTSLTGSPRTGSPTTISSEIYHVVVSTPATTISLAVTTNNAVADNTDTNGVQATVTDSKGSPVAGQTVTFTANNSAIVTTVIGVTGEDGIATATLTSTVAGTSKITATVNGNSTSIDTLFVAGSVSSATSTVNLNTKSYKTGQGSGVITLTLKDVSGNLITGQPLTDIRMNNTGFSKYAGSAAVSTSGSDVLGSITWVETGNGVYKGTYIPGKYSGLVTFTVAVGTVAIGSAWKIDIVANDTTAKVNSYTTQPASIYAGSGETYQIAAKVTDAFGNLYYDGVNTTVTIVLKGVLDNADSTFVGSNSPVLNNSYAYFYVSSTRVGDTVLTLTPSTNTAGSQNVTLNFVADASSGKVTFNLDNSIYNVSESGILQASYTDKYGNPLSGTVSFVASGSARIQSIAGVEGVTSYTFSGSSVPINLEVIDTVAESITISAKKGTQVLGTSSQIIFRANSDTYYISQINKTLTTGKGMADGQSLYKILVTAKDSFGNAASGATVQATLPDSVGAWVSTNSGGDTAHSQKTAQVILGSDGTASFYVNSYQPGDIALELELIFGGNTLENQTSIITFSPWLENAIGNVTALNSSKTWTASSGQPNNLVSGKWGNINIPINGSSGEYEYSTVVSPINLSNKSIPWMSIDASGQITVKDNAYTNAFPQTVYVYAKYVGTDNKPSRLWTWNVRRAWVYTGTALGMLPNNCTSRNANYPYMGTAKNFWGEWGTTLFNSPSGSTDRGPKYRYGSSETTFGYLNNNNGTSMYSSNSGAGFTSKSAQIWCYNGG